MLLFVNIFFFCLLFFFFFFSSRRRHTRCSRDWSSNVCSSDLLPHQGGNLNQKLQDTPDEHPYCQGGGRIFEVMPNDSNGEEDGRNVQHHRRSRRQSKDVEAIEDSHRECRQGDKKQVRENNPVQVHGLVAG